MAKESVGGIGDFNSYGSGRFAHPNIDLGEPKEREILGGRHIFNALSEIQRYHVIEDRSDEIPKEYFTIEQIIDYLKIGFKSGMLESFIFTALFCFLQVIYPSYKMYFLKTNVTTIEFWIFEILSYAPLLITTLFMMYISKYYKGLLTRRAIFALMNGRSFSFLLKGLLIFWLFSWLRNVSLENPKSIYSFADFTLFIVQFFKPNMSAEQLYVFYYKYMIPALYDTSYYVLYSMIAFAVLPYLTIFYRGYRNRVKKAENKDTYDEY